MWSVIGILASGILTLSGWTANLVPSASDNPRLLGKYAAALLMCGTSTVICALIGTFQAPGGMRRASRALGVVAALGALWAIVQRA